MSRASIEQHAKITPAHLARMAYVYVRQSSLHQVQEHLESQRRQYELVEWALARGWPREAIVVIDEDQGKSSATAKTRAGFARLLGAVASAEAGIVIALEVTRLARNSPDWHHLLYLCRFSATLIADAHTIYDPALSADRMVLGIRGQMGELELDSAIERMVSARWHKAQRGALITIPPPGYELDETVDNIVVDEMSMVDLPHLAILLRAIEVNQAGSLCRLILVGDENQLPPIDCGRPLHDVISFLRGDAKLEPKHMVRLRTNCRQKHDATVLDAAHLFAGKNRYQTELYGRILEGGQISSCLRVEYWESPEKLQAMVMDSLDGLLRRVAGRVPETREKGMNLAFGLYENGYAKYDENSERFEVDVDRVQILAPYRGGPSGSDGLSDFVRLKYRHDSWPEKWNWSAFGHSDKLICLRNIYRWDPTTKRRELQLSNGSIGILCNNKKGRRAYFPDVERPVPWNVDEEDFDLAYAITVHKAQGSEFEEVFVVIPERRALLSRELIYTALTRSKGPLTILVQKTERENPLQVARNRSVLFVRNSSLFAAPYDNRRLYEPEKGVRVYSKIEFIIYQALRHVRDAGRLSFAYERERTLTLDGRAVTVKPDFTVIIGARTYYWEHLGMLDLKDYSREWRSRRAGYEAEGLLDSLVTTDDLGGVHQQRVDKVIADMLSGRLENSAASDFSRHHYLLSADT